MEEIIRCPYCGEAIKATAKKCRHCGEWLEDKHLLKQFEPNHSQVEISENSFVNDFKWVRWACWFAMLFEVVGVIQTISDSFDSNFGFTGWLLNPIVNNVPDWFVVIISGVLWCVLLIGLRNYCRVRSLAKRGHLQTSVA